MATEKTETSSCLHKRRKGLEDRIEGYLIFCRPCNCLVYYIYIYIYISLYICIFECIYVCVCVYIHIYIYIFIGMYIYTQLCFPDGSAGKESTCNAGDPWVWFLGRDICWRRNRLPTPVFWPGEFHGLYGSWGCKELDMTEWLPLSLYIQINLVMKILAQEILHCSLFKKSFVIVS